MNLAALRALGIGISQRLGALAQEAAESGKRVAAEAAAAAEKPGGITVPLAIPAARGGFVSGWKRR